MSRSIVISDGRSAGLRIAGITLVVVLVIAGAAFAGYRRTVASASESGVPTATVIRGDVQSSVPADGRVVVQDWELDFGAPGRVASVDVREGATVTAGQTLATLDDAKALAQLTQAQSALASARAKLAALRNQPVPEEVAAKRAVVDSAVSALARAEEAYALLKAESLETTVSATELQAKSAAVQAAESLLDIAQANLVAAKVPASTSEIAAAEAAVKDASAGVTAAESARDDYVLRAPSDGVVVSIDLVEGQVLSTGSGQTPAIVVADILDQHVEGRLDEADAASVRAGMPVEMIVDGLGGMTVTGHVERVSEVALVDANELATFAFRVTLDEPVEGMAAGMAVRMQVITDQAADVLTIPTAAVKRSDGRSFVTVVDKSGDTKRTVVRLGKTDGRVVEVISGLSEGQEIAIGAESNGAK